MNIYDIQNKITNEPFFFSPDTMRFFGQTMADFEVELQEDGRYKISAPMKDTDGTYRGETVRFYNPITRKLERE